MTISDLAWRSAAWVFFCKTAVACLRSIPNIPTRWLRASVLFTPLFLRSWNTAMRIGFGIMGGSNQPLAHAQFVSNVVDYGMNIQGALSAPRFTIRDTGEPISCTIVVESRIAVVQDNLRQKGHVLIVRKEYSALMGRGQAVLHNSRTGGNSGASIGGRMAWRNRNPFLSRNLA